MLPTKRMGHALSSTHSTSRSLAAYLGGGGHMGAERGGGCEGSVEGCRAKARWDLEKTADTEEHVWGQSAARIWPASEAGVEHAPDEQAVEGREQAVVPPHPHEHRHARHRHLQEEATSFQGVSTGSRGAGAGRTHSPVTR